MAIDWGDIDAGDVAGWLRNVVIDRTAADYGNDNSRYEYAVLTRLAKRIALRTWWEMNELTMSRLLADEARRRVPYNPKWANRHRSQLDPDGGWVDRLTHDAETLTVTVGRDLWKKAELQIWASVLGLE